MLQEVKKELLKNPHKLAEVLGSFGYCRISVKPKYIQCARDDKEESSPTSIVIKLKNNDYLYVTDYPRNINCDLFSYIMEQRNVEFIEILNSIKKALGIIDYYEYFGSQSIFGGFYDNIKKKLYNNLNIYNTEILNQYEKCGNLRFLNDNISIDTQRYFDIRYDVASQSIAIPIKDQFGNLIGVKARINKDADVDEQKYYYLIPCMMSQTLYGYSQNYRYLVNNDIYIFESEKSVLQCYSYGIRNCLSIGSSSISQKQSKLIMELNPKRVLFMHDQGLNFEAIERNIKMFKIYVRMLGLQVGYWNSNQTDVPEKASLSDLGKERLLYGIDNEIIMIGDGKD